MNLSPEARKFFQTISNNWIEMGRPKTGAYSFKPDEHAHLFEELRKAGLMEMHTVATYRFSAEGLAQIESV